MRDTPAKRTTCVVGDRFGAFAEAVDAWSLSALVGAIDAGEFDEGPWPLDVVAGQGIDDYAASYLSAALARRGLTGEQVRIAPLAGPTAARQHVHKGREHNVLVAGLRQVDASTFAADVRLHDDNELVQDLQDRAHLPGVVVVEACRQMFVAVAERFFLADTPRRPHYLVINSMDVGFRNFLFPLPASMRLTVREADLSDPEHLAFDVDVLVEQADRPAAVARIAFAAFDRAVIGDKEQRRAKQALASVLDGAGSAS